MYLITKSVYDINNKEKEREKRVKGKERKKGENANKKIIPQTFGFPYTTIIISNC